MNDYVVTVYEATLASWITHGDHYEEHLLQTTETLQELAERLARTGFPAQDGRWIMPGAILEIKARKE